jgi:hypothetical protein
MTLPARSTPTGTGSARSTCWWRSPGSPATRALARLAGIVHAADIAQDRDSSPEGPGLHAIAHGFALLHGTQDHAKLDLETPMYDALYAWCQDQVPASST